LKIIEDESELAGVLSHEISHVVARHGIKRLQQVLGVQVLLSLAFGSNSETSQQVASTGIGLILQGYSRENEYEADQFGTYYMLQASYSPYGMRNLLNKFEQLSDKEPAFFEKLVATHPPMNERVAKVENQIKGYGEEAEKLPYNKDEYAKIKGRLK
jgi:predicted Zn-dependent protease